jgi:anti-sigma factor RsiW
MTEKIESSPDRKPESTQPLALFGVDQQMMTEYLLGELPTGQREKLEELLFSDPAFYHTLMVAEDRLIDDYLCCQLSQARQIRFEQYFLISERRREKLALSQTLHTTLAEYHEHPDSLAASLRRMPRTLVRIFTVTFLVISLLFIAAYLMLGQ